MSCLNNFDGDPRFDNEVNLPVQKEQEIHSVPNNSENETGGLANETVLDGDAYLYDVLPPEEEPVVDARDTKAPPPWEDVILEITNDYLKMYTHLKHPSPSVIRAVLLDAIRSKIVFINGALDRESKWPVPSELPENVIALILIKLHNVVKLALGRKTQDEELDQIGYYVSSGDSKGTYSTKRSELKKLCAMYRAAMKPRILTNIEFQIEILAPRKTPTDDPNLIAVNNGVFNYETKKLIDFSPDMIFLTKSPINYVEKPVQPIIRDPQTGLGWDVESWMNSLSDDPEIVNVLWQAIGASIRPGISWDKSIFLVSPQGNNGKGTLCQLIRNLCGEDNCVSLQISEMSKDFLLEPLIRASAIITDENDVSGFVDKAANFKAIITHDVIQVNRKHKTPVPFRFRGFMLQCLNDFPDFRDKSKSLYRRILMVPMDKCFTGVENKRIKSEYIARPDVLEWVLNRVLNMDYYELSEPASCMMKKGEFEEANDAVLQFAAEILPQLKWYLAPYAFLYDLFRAWTGKNNPSGKLPSKNTFTRKLNALVDNNPNWGWSQHPSKSDIRVKNLMSFEEPLIDEYHLHSWYSSTEFKSKYRGLVRSSVVESCEVGGPGVALSNQVANALDSYGSGNRPSSEQ